MYSTNIVVLCTVCIHIPDMVVHCVHTYVQLYTYDLCVPQQTLMDWFVLDAAADVSTWCGAAGWYKSPSFPFPSIPFPSPIQGGCAFVAFLLHYFFLAAFSWMLCEGVVLYNLLVKVFGANDRKWIYIYSALGWGESGIRPSEPAVFVWV